MSHIVPSNTGIGTELGSNQGKLERGKKFQGARGPPQERATAGMRARGRAEESRPKTYPAEKD